MVPFGDSKGTPPRIAENLCQHLHFFIGIIDAEGGGILKKGFTMVDNNVYDYLMGAELTCTELKILLAIIRYTTGFHRKECTLTASFISKITNKGIRIVRYALKTMSDKGLIVKKQSKKNQIITYSLGVFGLWIT